jgi:hypothetical protein
MASATDEQSNVGESDIEQVVKFFKQKVMGRTVALPKSTFKLDGDKMEGESEEQITYNNFSETADGFSFDAISVTKESRHDLDKDGRRIGPARQVGGTVVDHYEFGERASTKKLTGTIRTVFATTKHQKQDGTVVLVLGVKIADGKLTWTETQPGYGDFTAAGGKLKPGSIESKCTFSVVEGKLQTKYLVTRFDVDPDTFQRTPEKNQLPPFVSKEIDSK